MAAPPIPLGLIGTGLTVEKPHLPALHRLADPDLTFVVDENTSASFVA